MKEILFFVAGFFCISCFRFFLAALTALLFRTIMITYYAAFLVGVWVVVQKDFYQLSALLTYTGGVAAFAVAFYCWKSKAENLEKIKKNNPDIMGSLSDFSGMGSQ